MAVTVLQRVSKFQTIFILQGVHKLWPSQGHNSLIHCAAHDSSPQDAHSLHEESSSQGPNGEDTVRNKILAASLPFVLQHGWTRNAISAGAESVGFPGIAHGMFPRGGADLVQYFYMTSNKELACRLRKEVEEAHADTSKKKDPSLFVHDAVKARLLMITPYLTKWPQALGIMTLPPNVTTSLANLLILVDDICYYAGDRSVNFSWYTHRVTLAGIYKATELCLVQDNSEEFQETWQFLNRRIEEVEQLQHCLSQTEEVTQVAKEAVTAAFITARNILGLNLGDR